VITHMTAHFKGGPLADQSKYRTCDKAHNHSIAVKDLLPIYTAGGHYEIDGDALSVEAFGELLVDVVYHWVTWADV
jgi:hypothetical protein